MGADVRPFRIVGEESHEGSARRVVLDYDSVFKLLGATPSVKNQTRFKTSGAVVTVTNFLDGAQGQRIHILGDGTTTVAHNSTIKRTGGANAVIAADKVYNFMYVDGVWYEDA